MSHDAYRAAARKTATPRQVEYTAFAEATRGLIGLGDAATAELKSLAEAIHANRMLWGVLAEDCANPANRLPAPLRAQIISLSRWVSTYSSDVLRRRESLDPLVEVNRIMMDGLAGKQATEAAKSA